MRKRKYGLFTILLIGLALFLAACGETEAEESEPEVEASEAEEVGEEEEAEEEVAEEETAEAEESSEISNEVYEDEEFKFVFGDAEQIEGKYGDEILAIEVKFTNKTDSPESPWMVAAMLLEMNEVTEVTTEPVIGGLGQIPEDYRQDFYEMDTEINGGETVNTVISFEIQEPGSTIEVRDRTLDGEPEQFEWVYETTE